MTVYENDHYLIQVVETPNTEEWAMFPSVYKIQNKKSGVIEAYEKLLPKAMAYATQASETIDAVTSGPKKIKTLTPSSYNSLQLPD